MSIYKTVWISGKKMTTEKLHKIALLREAGCKCDLPLLGEKNSKPRCRLCNTEAKE